MQQLPKSAHPEKTLSETLYFPDQTLKHMMRDAMLCKIMRDLRKTMVGPGTLAGDNTILYDCIIYYHDCIIYCIF